MMRKPVEGSFKDNNDLNQVESAILDVSRGLSHENAHQRGGESVECSSLFLYMIISVLSLENVLKSVSNEFDGLVGRKNVF